MNNQFTADQKNIISRYNSGDYITNFKGSYWWHKQTKVLAEPCSSDEVYALHTLLDQGVIEKQTKTL